MVGENLEASQKISTCVKVQLYNSLVLAVLLHGAETWPMTKSTTRKLEAAHHRWLKKILQISWKDKVTNEKVRELAPSEADGTCHEDGLTENCQTSYQLETNTWQKTSRPTSYRLAAVKVDIRKGGISSKQIPDLAVDRGAWRELIALYAINTEGTKI